MEERGHGYGGPAAAGGGGGGLDASGGSGARPTGWSSLTRLLRNPSPPPRDPFPPLATTTSSNNHAQQQHVATSSGERSQQGGSNNIQQQRVASPASSTGSLSSNYSGRNQNRGHHADAPPAFSSNAADAGGGDQQGVFSTAGGSPPESSSGSFAPNSSAVNCHPARAVHHHGHGHGHGHGHQSRGSRPVSSAGSFAALNPYPSGEQSGAYDARLGGFQSGSQVVQNEREREVSGGAKRSVQINNGHKSALRRRELNSYEVVIDEGRRDATFAAERNGLEPAVSDGRSSIGDADRDVNGAHERQGRDAGDSTAASSAVHVPMEPEWEEEDMYLRVRSDALKEARARDKFARGASQAYVRGDHRKAKTLSKQAEEKRLIAEKLHAEAAFEILDQRNKHGSFDIWHLDLHGLHTVEAVAALESRLALLEHGLTEDHKLGLLSSASRVERGEENQDVAHKVVLHPEGGRAQQEDHKHKLFQSLIPASKHLSVVTGVGAHSQGGPTLPSAVKTYLINNGYQVEEPRAGVVSVRPKLRFSVRVNLVLRVHSSSLKMSSINQDIAVGYSGRFILVFQELL